MRRTVLAAVALAVGASLADLGRERPPDTAETEHAAMARRGSLGPDDYVATNVYPCASAYRLRRVTDGRLADRAVNDLDLADGTSFALPAASVSPGFARGFLAVVDCDADTELVFTGAARLFTGDFSGRIVAERGTSVFSFIEIRPDEYLVESRTLTAAGR